MQKPPQDNSQRLFNKIILIADDEEMNLYLISAYLSNSGAQLIYATNGKEAVELCRSNKIDLVLMDVHMPIMDGLEATEIIKENCNIPVIAVSALKMDLKSNDPRISLFDNYLEKPIKQEYLIQIIDSVLSSDLA